jgi:hypothetical protein
MTRSHLRRSARTAIAAYLVLAAGALPALAADPPPAAADIDAGALAALDHMGAYLRTLKVFQVEAASQREDVLDNGLKVQFQAAISLAARPPDRLWAKVSSDRQEREFFYNGKQFTLWAPRPYYYATVPAPATIRELVDATEAKYGVELPLVDLFRWGTEGDGKAGIIAAMDIGPGTVGGAACRHYAFRQEGLDWQIWIQNGDFPLPRKLVLTTTSEEARPQFQATYTWDLAPTLDETDFTFQPPADALPIPFDEVKPDVGAKQQEK